MKLVEKIIQIGIFAMCLAIYTAWLQDMFLSLFPSVGFGEMTLGFFFVSLIAYALSWVMIKIIKRSAREEEAP